MERYTKGTLKFKNFSQIIGYYYELSDIMGLTIYYRGSPKFDVAAAINFSYSSFRNCVLGN